MERPEKRSFGAFFLNKSINPVRKGTTSDLNKNSSLNSVWKLPLSYGVKVIFKGSFRDPLLYFGFISVIFFGAVVFVYSSSETKSDFKKMAGVGSWLIGEKSEFLRAQSFIVSKEPIKESPDFYRVQNNSLASIVPPVTVTPQILGALADGSDIEEFSKEVIEYAVGQGDTVWSIAEKFNISQNSILWANELSGSSIIKPGQKLIIPPVSGVLHYVKEGDTLIKIANLYKAEIDEIIAFNNLSQGGDIFIGDVLVIPGGVMPPKAVPVQYAPVAISYFICPISSPCRITQGLHWYNAIDFSRGKCGEPIYAAAAGNVLKVQITSSRAKSAFNGAGNHLTILHPNGVVTFYGHILINLVNPGDYVSQGQLIALIGGQPGTPGAGRSSGCHLHFGVNGARNPFAR